MLKSPTKAATFFDSTKFDAVVKSIDFPIDEPENDELEVERMIMSQDELSDDDFDEITNEIDEDYEMEVEEPDDHTIKEEMTKPFNNVSPACKGRKVQHLVDAIDAFANEENTTFLKVICFMAQRRCYKTKGQRKLSKVFSGIAEKGEEYIAPNEVSVDQAIAIKQTLQLSFIKYDSLVKMLKSKLVMPHSHKVSDKENSMTPKAIPYLDGVKYDLKECFTDSVKTIFDVKKMKPEEIPKDITVKGAIGEDGSGGHAQRRGKDININTRNRIIGGFRLSRIHSGPKLIHQELSQGAESERPIMIVPGKESAERVRKIWSDIEKEFNEVQVTTMLYEGVRIKVKFLFHIQGDGKEKQQLSGLGGAFCILCFVTEEDANDLDRIKEGFSIERSLEQIWELWNELTKGGTCEIKKETRDYETRQGLTQMPMLTKKCSLDPTKSPPEMHFIIHVFGYIKTLYQTLKARQILGRLPNRGSKGRGNKIPEEDEEALIEALEFFTMKVREPPLNLIINAPDPHGHGGSVENGNTCRIFLAPSNREAVMNIFSVVATAQEIDDLKEFFQEAYVIYHLSNSTGKIDTDAFSEYVQKAHEHWKHAFPYQKIKESIHWTMGHIGEVTEMNDGYGAGDISEGSLEVCHKNGRRISNTLARQTSFYDNCKDTMKRMWLDSHPVTRQYKPKSKKRKNKIVSDDDEVVRSFFI